MASVIGLIYTIGQNLMDRYYDVNEYNNELIRFQMWCYSICNIGSAGVWNEQNKTTQSSLSCLLSSIILVLIFVVFAFLSAVSSPLLKNHAGLQPTHSISPQLEVCEWDGQYHPV
jgi:hypothetical protein